MHRVPCGNLPEVLPVLRTKGEVIEITFILIYGDDGTGKSIQCQKIAEVQEEPVHLSLAIKNRRLYRDNIVESRELLKFSDDDTINPYKTMDAFQSEVSRIIKDNVNKCVVLDEIAPLRTFAQPCAIEWFNRNHSTKVSKISESNFLAWEHVNQITYGVIERLNNWAVINDALILAITSLSDVRILEKGDDGKMHSITTGQTVVNAKENIRKIADVRVRLDKDGKYGRGYWATYEKLQAWMNPEPDHLKITQDGLLGDFMVRGILE